MLATALAVDLSPPRPWEWLSMDLDFWQELIDCRNAYDAGRREVAAEAEASAANRQWAASQRRREG